MLKLNNKYHKPALAVIKCVLKKCYLYFDMCITYFMLKQITKTTQYKYTSMSNQGPIPFCFLLFNLPFAHSTNVQQVKFWTCKQTRSATINIVDLRDACLS